jgi:hypothetical protein
MQPNYIEIENEKRTFPSDAHHTALCEPSQSGLFLVCLQAQKNAFLSASAVQAMGEKSEPLCEPSQKGWFLDWPQAHQ